MNNWGGGGGEFIFVGYLWFSQVCARLSSFPNQAPRG